MDAGDDVVAVVRQRGRSKATGLPPLTCTSLSGGRRTECRSRMRMYANPQEATLEAAGLRE